MNKARVIGGTVCAVSVVSGIWGIDRVMNHPDFAGLVMAVFFLAVFGIIAGAAIALAKI